MKKLFTLLALSLFFAFEASAKVYICKEEIGSGKSFTTSSSSGISLNGGTLRPYAGKTAKISRTGNTITLEWAIIECTASNSAMRVEEDGITIKIVGSCSIKATKSDYDGLQINTSGITTTIKGEGENSSSFFVTGQSDAIYIKKNSTLTMRDLYLQAKGGDWWCIHGDDNKATLKFEGNDFHVLAECSSVLGTAIGGLESISIPSGYNYDDGSYFDKNKHDVVNVKGGSRYRLSIIKEEYYGLKVYGTEVTSCNHAVLAYLLDNRSMLISGDMNSVKYNDYTKVLSLDNATVSGLGPAINNYGVPNLVIEVNGTTNLTSTSYDDCIDLSDNTTITGTGTLNLKGASYSGVGYATRAISMKSSQKSLSINTTVNCSGTYYGITGVSGNLALNKCKLSVSSTSGAISSWTNITFTGNDIATEGCFFNPSKNGITNVKQETVNNVDVKLVSTEYDLSIMGRKLNDVNCKSFACQGMTSGSISYVNSSKVLTFHGVTMTNPSSYENACLTSSINNLDIYISGTNKLTSKGDVFRINGSTTFVGDVNSGQGSLTATSTNGSAYAVMSTATPKTTTLTLRGGKLYFYGKKCGFDGLVANESGYTVTLNMKKYDTADYAFKGEDNGAIYRFNKVNMTDVDYNYNGYTGTPGCYFDSSKKAVCQNGSKVVKGSFEVLVYAISETYPVTVGGVKVTDVNCRGIGSSAIKSSTGGTLTGKEVAYNPDTKTLSLNGVTIDSPTGICVNSSVAGLTVNVSGKTVLKDTGLSYSGNTTVIGSGTLESGLIADASNATLTLKNINATFTKTLTSASNNKLVVDLTTAGRKITVKEGVTGWNSVTLNNGTKIVKPAGGYYDTNKKSVVDASGNKATEVEFADKTATAIDAIEVANDNEVKQIYDATGRESDTAKRGLNIIRMSDGTVRKVMVK